MDCVGRLFVQKNIEKQFEEFRRLKVHFITVVIVIEIRYGGRCLPRVKNDMTETVPLLPGTDDQDDLTTISSRSSSSTSTSAAQAAKLKPILSEKKLEQLRRAKARKIKEELLRIRQ